MKSALVIITEGSEELEAVTVIDVLRRGNVSVVIAAAGEDCTVTCANGCRLVADNKLSEIISTEVFDALVLPGGSKAAHTYSEAPQVQSLLKEFQAKDKLVAVICASTLAIHAADVFTGRRVTSYPSLRSQVEDKYEYQEESVVIDKNLITSRGPATALPFALAIVQYLVGQETSEKVAKDMLYM